jgi:hypothetical protein
MSLILATQEAEIRRIEVRSQPWQILLHTQSTKNPTKKKKKKKKVKALSPSPSTSKQKLYA